MNNAMWNGETAHLLWKELLWRLPPSAEATVVSILHLAKEIARLLAQPRVPFYELKGQTAAGPITVAYGGLSYARPDLERQLFLEEPTRREIIRVPFWRARKLASASDCDLSVVEAPKYLIRALPTQAAITLPFRLNFLLDLNGEWGQIEQRFGPKNRQHIRKAGEYSDYHHEISQNEEDLRLFYHKMYLPTVQSRHGRAAAILPEREAFQLLRHGNLFLIKRDGRFVAGSIIRARHGVVEEVETGVLDGSSQLLKAGVNDALSYLLIRWAHQEGFSAYTPGDNWPFLSGLFHSKLKWGTKVGVSPNEHKRLWLQIRRDTPAVKGFFIRNPIVTVNARNELSALLVTDHPDRSLPENFATTYKLHLARGLSGYHICFLKDLIGGNA